MPIVVFLISNYFLIRILLTGSLFNLICPLFPVLLHAVVFGLHPTLITLNNTFGIKQVDQFAKEPEKEESKEENKELNKEIKSKIKQKPNKNISKTEINKPPKDIK